MLSRAQFESDIAPLRAALEARRRKYLRYHYIGMLIAAGLIASAIFCPVSVLHDLQRIARTPVPLKVSDILAYRIFALVFGSLFVLGPVWAYRGERGFSVERAVMNRIMSSFGAFIFLKNGAITSPELRRHEFPVSSLHFHPEAGVTGELNGKRVRISEATIYEGRNRVVFSGLVILTELQSSPASLPEQLADAMKKLSLDHYDPRWDEKLTYFAAAFCIYVKEALLARMGKNELPAEKAYRLQYALRPRFTRTRHPEMSVYPDSRVEFSASARLAMLARGNGLFELGSLFVPVFPEKHMDGLYDVMNLADALTL
jgi:hypothetical protein